MNQSKNARNLIVLANKIKSVLRRHFNREDRIVLGALKRAGVSQSEIGRQLGFHRSSISRELKRNPKPRGGYHALKADVQATTRRQQAKREYRKINDSLGVMLAFQLQPLVSTEVVAHRVRNNEPTGPCGGEMGCIEVNPHSDRFYESQLHILLWTSGWKCWD